MIILRISFLCLPWLKKVLLPFAFYNIMGQLETIEMGKFCDCLEKNWITGKIWPPITWSVFRMVTYST